MKQVILAIAAFALMQGAAFAAPPEEDCDVPQSFVDSDADLANMTKEFKEKHRLSISVVGTGSSALTGPEGARFAYPARLEDALKQRLPGTEVKVTAHVQSRQVTSSMVSGLDKVLADDKPALVIWQAGTADALSGVEPEDFRASLDEGVQKIQAAGADVILMNMQYSPRTELDARRFRLCRHHACGCAAARRAVVRSARDHALLERRRHVRPLCRYQEV